MPALAASESLNHPSSLIPLGRLGGLGGGARFVDVLGASFWECFVASWMCHGVSWGALGAPFWSVLRVS